MLGNLYYDKRQYDLAVEAWERSSSLNPGSPMVWRNLALAYFNKLDRHDQALELIRRAIDESLHQVGASSEPGLHSCIP